MNALFSYSLSGLSLVSVFLMPDATTPEAIVPVWIWRAFVSILIVIVGYFLKKLLDENKESNERRDKKLEDLVRITGAHDIMYQVWLENLAGDLQGVGGRRKVDRIAGALKQITEETETKND